MLILGLCGITLGFYSLIRVLYLVWNAPSFTQAHWAEIFYSYLLGIRFDAWAVTYLAFPAILIQALSWIFKRHWNRSVTAVFLIMQSPFFILNLVDIEFVNFMGRRFMRSSMVVANEVQGKMWAVLWSYKFLFLSSTLLFGFFLVAIFFWYRRISARRGEWPLKIQFMFAGLCVVLAGLACRGGLQRKPLNIAHSQVFTVASLSHLSLNSTFTLLRTWGGKTLPREHWMDDEKMLAYLTANRKTTCDEGLPQFAKKQNVVLLILESFSLEHMGKIHGDKGYTPFLDELAEKSLFFPNAFANGRRSIEGIAALIGGIPALMYEPFIKSRFVTNDFHGWGNLIGEDEYASTFYHGGQNGTMYFDQFSLKSGIQRYYGENEFPIPGQVDGTWGVWDEPFLLNAITDLQSQPRPFTATIFTLTSHNPFVVPKEYKDHFPKGPDPIHEVIGYTDQSLRKFFAAAEKQDWYKDTLFIISADHTHTAGRFRPRYKDVLGSYRIPILFFHPSISKWPAIDTQEPVQQIDILPSVLDFLHKKPAYINLLGKSVFCRGPRYASVFLDDEHWLIGREHVLHMDTKGQTHLKLLEDLTQPVDKPVKYFSANLISKDDLILKKKLEDYMLAYRQYFSEGLWDNRLYVVIKDNQYVFPQTKATQKR